MVDVAAKIGALLANNSTFVASLVTYGAAQEQIVNGGFENGTNGWTNSSPTADEHHAGSYSDHLAGNSSMNQTVALAVGCANVTNFGFWHKGISATGGTETLAYVTVWFSDNSFSVTMIPDVTPWTYLDLMTVVAANITKTIVQVEFTAGFAPTKYIDDVSLTGKETIIITNDNPVLVTYDEFDPRCPAVQLLLENFPEKKKWVHDAVYRVEHTCRLTLFLKPMRYVETEIVVNKTLFFAVKEIIDTILMINKYSITDITNLELSANGWNDKNSVRVGRGTKDMGTFIESLGGKDTAILFRSEQTVTAIYYIGE